MGLKPLTKFLVVLQLLSQVASHLTVTPIAEECKAGGCAAGGYGFYVNARFAHSDPGNYTYKVSMKIPKLSSATIRPEFVPGWALTFNPDANPNDRWIHYTAYRDMEVYDKWVGMFQLSVAFKCGSSTSPLELMDSLIVPMGTSSSGKTFFGALFPARQYLCEMVGGVCVPNGRYEEWAGFTNASYDSVTCGDAAEATPGSCNSKCRGSRVPCVSFTVNTSACGIVTTNSGVEFGNMDAAGEGGNFPTPPRTRDLMQNPFASFGATIGGSTTTAVKTPSPTITTPASSPTSIADPIITSFKVKLSLTIPMSLAAFNSSIQQTFKEVIAVASGLTKADANRVEVSARAARRRLLQSAMALDVTVNMPDASSAKKATEMLTKDTINTGLAAAGLPPATITSAAVQSSAAATPRPSLFWAAVTLFFASAAALV
jgi:hypothetical protein